MSSASLGRLTVASIAVNLTKASACSPGNRTVFHVYGKSKLTGNHGSNLPNSAERRWDNNAVSFVADDLAAWLVGLLADSGRKRLTAWLVGDEQQRALRQAATAAVQSTAGDLCAGNEERAEEQAMVISQVFGAVMPPAPLRDHRTLLEALQAGVAGQLAVLDDPGLTGTGVSSAQVLGVATEDLADRLAGHLVREIIVSGSQGGPLEPLAAQLNHDLTHVQGHRLESLLVSVREALTGPSVWQAQPPAIPRGALAP